jgi:hypothetical protein
MGDLLSLFLIGLIFSIHVPYSLQLLDSSQFILFAVLTAFSVYGSIIWRNTIKNIKKYTHDSRKDNSTIQRIEDRGSIYIVYMVKYISLIPLLSGTLEGLVAFGIIILIVYSLYINSDMLFYNPVLAALGYKFYKIEISYNYDPDTENTDEIYVISKLKLVRTRHSKMSRYKFYSLTA